MPSTSPRAEPEPRARCFRLSRRHLLGAGAALVVSSALPISAYAAQDAAFSDSPDTMDAGAYPVQALALDWPPAPPPSSIITVPYVTQLDGSPQARANCGPASLAMLLARFGDGTSVADIRWSVNRFMGAYWVDNGATWEALANAAETRGYQVIGLFAGAGKYRKWTVDDLVAEINRDNPVMILVRYRALPGRESSYYRYNHFVVVVGVDPDGSIVYHDPAYPDFMTGAYLRMSRQQLVAAWSSVTTGIDYTGMVVGPKGM